MLHMATTHKKKGETTAKADKFIKVKTQGHTEIKIQAAKRGRTMGEHVVILNREDMKK